MTTDADIREQVLAALQVGPTTRGDLCTRMHPRSWYPHDYRAIGRALQSLRRAGLIEWKLVGNKPYWSITKP